MLFVGDLSYADNYPYHDNVRWDTWARFVERNVAYQPWIWTAGNHEIDFAPELVCSIILHIISYAICFNGCVGSSKSRYFTRAMLSWNLHSVAYICRVKQSHSSHSAKDIPHPTRLLVARHLTGIPSKGPLPTLLSWHHTQHTVCVCWSDAVF